MSFNVEVYEVHLATFREALHPRGLNGRFIEVLDRLEEFKPKRETWYHNIEKANKDRPYPLPNPTPTEQTTQELQDFVDDGDVAIRLFAQDLVGVLEDGEFKNIHESGHSNGMDDPQGRAKLEGEIWGQRPVYGYVTATSEEPNFGGEILGVEWYGDIEVVLDDSVKDRTTITIEDSLMSGIALPSPARHIDPWTAAGFKTDDSGNPTGYVEAQIFGGVSTDDILGIEFGTGAPDRRLKRLLQKRGIPWRVNSRWYQAKMFWRGDENTSYDEHHGDDRKFVTTPLPEDLER